MGLYRVKCADKPENWITEDFHLKHAFNIEMMQASLEKASSPVSYSWIVKNLITKNFAGNPKRTLDVGCGFGRGIVAFQNAVGLDICLPFLRTARNYTPHEYVLADAQSLPFRSEIFDFVSMTEVIEHLDTPEKSIDEIIRVLVRGGKFAVQTPNNKVTGRMIDKKYGHMKEYSRKEIVDMLREKGLKIETVTGSTIPYIPTTHKWFNLNFNRPFFMLWKTMNRIVPLRWDIIILGRKTT